MFDFVLKFSTMEGSKNLRNALYWKVFGIVLSYLLGNKLFRKIFHVLSEIKMIPYSNLIHDI